MHHCKASQQTQNICITFIQCWTKQLYNIYTMLDQRRRRWTDVVYMLWKCFVFAGMVYIFKDMSFMGNDAPHRHELTYSGSMSVQHRKRWPNIEIIYYMY